ncbi:MAG: anaerobic ribonucleoside-triphosphate reductase activating protein [Prevotellaceae bacterium]|jgi:anaerobic ribonucleoside-triphosphate reductase activating protein|nr:anaerobic ribonucleoside-triphosphate reductase activating protein [Prevotellaceae bacterium]
MLRYISYDIVFREIPEEVTLAVNLTGCPYRCRGCHSPHLQEDVGDELTAATLSALLDTYGDAVTCVCFMGGDGAPDEVMYLASLVRQAHKKTAWYSGSPTIFAEAPSVFDYIKAGPYIESLGGLDSPTTNQRLYRTRNGKLEKLSIRNCLSRPEKS